MRISDWSSDVCSSDLAQLTTRIYRQNPILVRHAVVDRPTERPTDRPPQRSCQTSSTRRAAIPRALLHHVPHDKQLRSVPPPARAGGRRLVPGGPPPLDAGRRWDEAAFDRPTDRAFRSPHGKTHT